MFDRNKDARKPILMALVKENTDEEHKVKSSCKNKYSKEKAIFLDYFEKKVTLMKKHIYKSS